MCDYEKALHYRQRMARMRLLEKNAQSEDLKAIYQKLAVQWSEMMELALSDDTVAQAELIPGGCARSSQERK